LAGPAEVLETASLALVAFLVTIDPVGLVPIFLALTPGEAGPGRRRIALKGTALGGAILIGAALFGDRGLEALGIGIPAFRIAGGITLLLLAVEMVFQHRGPRRSTTAESMAGELDPGGVAVFPLAMPLIAGPAAITTVILQVSRQDGNLAGDLAVLAALLASLVVTGAVLVAASYLGRALGPTLVLMLSRLLGLLLAALSVQFVIDGVKEAFGL
jgi:multiple antibiotic resistance protein